MSSCTECHGAEGNQHTSENCPRFKRTNPSSQSNPTQNRDDELRKKIYRMLTEDQSTAVQESFIGDLQEYEADEIMILIHQHTEEAVKETLLSLRNTLPDPDDNAQFSPNGSGGWHTPTYKLAAGDFIRDIDALIDELTTTERQE